MRSRASLTFSHSLAWPAGLVITICGAVVTTLAMGVSMGLLHVKGFLFIPLWGVFLWVVMRSDTSEWNSVILSIKPRRPAACGMIGREKHVWAVFVKRRDRVFTSETKVSTGLPS